MDKSLLTLPGKKVLVAGWFSFEHGHATGGDMLAMEVTCNWLRQAGFDHIDVALDPPFEGGVNWRTVPPEDYSHAVFVCGPFELKAYEAQFLTRFANSRLIGLNLSMIPSLDSWQPFDLLYERNSDKAVRPDMVFLSERPRVPVVGICLVEPYPGALDAEANAAIQRLIDKHEVAVVYIDTRLDVNGTHLRTPAEIESLIAQVDALVTTRLHGAVMAIKNGVPVLPIDPEAGGAKIVLQMNKLGWPVVFAADELDDDAMEKAFAYCLAEEARQKASSCCRAAIGMLEETRVDFMRQLTGNGTMEQNFRKRSASKEIPAWAKTILEKQKDQAAPTRKKNMKPRMRKLAYLLLPGFVFYALQRLKRL